MRALITNVQRFSLGDGPGIRTTVFFKGCSLSCRWCHNPECVSARQQLMHSAAACARCGRCAAACPAGALSLGNANGPLRYQPETCRLCLACVAACPTGALRPAAADVCADELFALLRKDKAYYLDSGGGVTFSGGESLLQLPFLEELGPRLKGEGIPMAAETAGNVPPEIFARAQALFDLFLMDIKLMDSSLHRRYAGVGNELPLENMRSVRKPLIVRMPLVRGITFTRENLERAADWLRGLPTLKRVDLLPYHALGVDKSKQLLGGSEQPAFEAPSDDEMDQALAFFAGRGIRAQRE